MIQSPTQLFAWAGPVFTVVVLSGAFFMGFLPPLHASLDAESVSAIYEANRTPIRIGATAILQCLTFMFLWTAAISSQIRRIEGEHTRLLTYSQMLLGLVANLVFFVMSLSWTIAAFRAERSAELVMMLNDMGWLTLVMPVFPLTLQAFVIGIAILSDRSDTPLFPRWSGFMNFWIGILFLPGALATFYKTGPFAWHGFLVFWVPFGAFVVWVFLMAWLVTRADKTSYRSAELEN